MPCPSTPVCFLTSRDCVCAGICAQYGITASRVWRGGRQCYPSSGANSCVATKGCVINPDGVFLIPRYAKCKDSVLGAIVATAVVPVNAFIARSMASSLPEGSISALAYAFRVFMLPVSLFAVPVYTVC